MVKLYHELIKYLKLLVIVLILLMLPSKSYAYLDPGSSSILIQLIILITIFLSTLNTRIRNFFSKIISKFKTKKKNIKK